MAVLMRTRTNQLGSHPPAESAQVAPSRGAEEEGERQRSRNITLSLRHYRQLNRRCWCRSLCQCTFRELLQKFTMYMYVRTCTHLSDLGSAQPTMADAVGTDPL